MLTAELQIASRLYEEALATTSWWEAAQFFPEIHGQHVQRVMAAKRLCRRYAKTYGETWPLEDVDLAEGREAYDQFRVSQDWEVVANLLNYGSWREAFDHAGQYALANAQVWPPKVHTKGQAAYEARSSSMGWDQVAETVGLQTSTSAIRLAKDYATEVGLGWPIPVRSTPTELESGESAYHIKAANPSMLWKHVGEKLGFSRDYTARAARLYAQAYNQSWPLSPDRRPLLETGERAYLRRAEWNQYETWEDIGKKFGITADSARAFAAKYAKTKRKAWPIPKPLGFRLYHVGKDAYDMRKAVFCTWYVIGAKFDKKPDYCAHAAKQYAEDKGLPWPIAPPEGMTIRKKLKDTGKRSYEARLKGTPWNDIAEELEISHAWALKQARSHAREFDLDWPPPIPHAEDPRRRPYEMRSEGRGWDEIAQEMGLALSSVREQAKRYAEANGLAWPLRVAPVRPQSEKASEAYRRAYINEDDWENIARDLGYKSKVSCQNSVQAYARTAGLPYTVRTRQTYKKNPLRGKKAYELRAGDPSLTWSTISEQLGFKAPRSAHTAAKQWADKKGLFWPV